MSFSSVSCFEHKGERIRLPNDLLVPVFMPRKSVPRPFSAEIYKVEPRIGYCYSTQRSLENFQEWRLIHFGFRDAMLVLGHLFSLHAMQPGGR